MIPSSSRGCGLTPSEPARELISARHRTRRDVCPDVELPRAPAIGLENPDHTGAGYCSQSSSTPLR